MGEFSLSFSQILMKSCSRSSRTFYLTNLSSPTSSHISCYGAGTRMKSVAVQSCSSLDLVCEFNPLEGESHPNWSLYNNQWEPNHMMILLLELASFTETFILYLYVLI